MARKSIVIRLNSTDIAAARFTISPAHELVRIVRALVAPSRFPAHRSLLRDVRTTAPIPALQTLTQVITGRGYVPDFLTPLTEDPAMIVDLIRATPTQQVITELHELADDGRADPVALDRLTSALIPSMRSSSLPTPPKPCGSTQSRPCGRRCTRS